MLTLLTQTIRTARALQASRALVAAAVVLLTGCGGSHGSGTAETSAVATPGATTMAATTTTRLPPRTISVEEYEFGFSLSQNTISQGKVTFLMRNTGSLIHNFALIGKASGAFLTPGQIATMTVALKPGTYIYVCGVKDHAAEGMQGTLVVTP